MYVDQLEELITQGKSTFGNKERRSIDVNDALEILEDIRREFPIEIEEARKIMREYENILESADHEANRILEDARQQALIIASEQEIVRIAQTQAENIVADARDAEMEMRAGAEDYADTVFSHIENTLNQMNENVRRCRERLNNRSGH
jgi:cell division septum initiation protein DivIVA